MLWYPLRINKNILEGKVEDTGIINIKQNKEETHFKTTVKLKVNALQGFEYITTEIISDNKVIKQIKLVRFFGCNITYTNNSNMYEEL